MRLRTNFSFSARDWAVIVQYYVEQGVMRPADIARRSRLLGVILFNVAKKMSTRLKYVPADDLDALRILQRHGGFKTFETFEVDRAKLKETIKRKEKKNP